MSGNSKTLLSLPPEILESVAGKIEAVDLISFRSACKEIETKTFKVFSRTCFARRTLRLSSEMSLRHNFMVIDLKVFGPMLREIAFLIDKPQPGAMSREAIQAATFRQNRWDLRLLKRLFRFLDDFDRQVKITITTSGREHAKTAPLRLQAPSVDDCSAFTTILEAMSSSNYKPKEVTINGTAGFHEAWHLPIHKLTINNGLELCHQALASVESLTLDMWFEDEDSPTSAAAFFCCIASLPDLKFLTIRGRKQRDETLKYFDVDSNAIAKALLKKDFPELKILKLSGCTALVADVVDFLQRHTLKHKLEKSQIGGVKWDWAGIDQVVVGENGGEVHRKALEMLSGVQVEHFNLE